MPFFFYCHHIQIHTQFHFKQIFFFFLHKYEFEYDIFMKNVPHNGYDIFLKSKETIHFFFARWFHEVKIFLRNIQCNDNVTYKRKTELEKENRKWFNKINAFSERLIVQIKKVIQENNIQVCAAEYRTFSSLYFTYLLCIKLKMLHKKTKNT